MSAGWRVADITVPAGAMIRHALELGELPDGARVNLPLALLNGARPGPTFYVGAAIHGDEANGVAIVSRLLTSLDPGAVAGRLICVPVQNPLAFQVDHRVPGAKATLAPPSGGARLARGRRHRNIICILRHWPPRSRCHGAH